MISHQDIGIQPVTESLLIFLQQFEIALPIRPVLENPLPLVSSGHDMVQRSLVMNSRFSRHKGSLRQIYNNVNKACLTPFYILDISIDPRDRLKRFIEKWC